VAGARAFGGCNDDDDDDETDTECGDGEADLALSLLRMADGSASRSVHSTRAERMSRVGMDAFSVGCGCGCDADADGDEARAAWGRGEDAAEEDGDAGKPVALEEEDQFTLRIISTTWAAPLESTARRTEDTKASHSNQKCIYAETIYQHANERIQQLL
jgi:hypothetical protein